jgi:hypothetical protein
MLTVHFSAYEAKKVVYPFKAYWLRDLPTGLTFNNRAFCPHFIYVFLYLSENKKQLVPLTP